eukprot:CAMPEP_0185729924 /NCGR_PEP_ID=MMETSP1171-20130828/7758_1 /TAXON_ID=374046 /ORGANISM="Helicotheca tamensis, Strain CCMP826" /LENGTH=477 /DNA_ID=CAMNT_0028398867 /DNA_START=146 /DNA_END=1579 /DNA_ORIENTATION=-
MTSMTAIFSAIVCLYWLVKEIEFMMQRKKLPPGGLGHPLLGYFLPFIRNPSKYSSESFEKYGPVFSEKMFARVGIVFKREEEIKRVWNTERKGQSVGFWIPSLLNLIGHNSLVAITGKRHRSIRKILEPIFAPNALRDYFETMDGVVLEFLSKWSSSSEDPIFHSSEQFKMFSMRLFFTAAFGGIEDDIAQQLHDDFKIWFSGLVTPLPYRIPGTAYARAMNARDRIMATFDHWIHRFKAENSPESEKGQNSLIGRLCYGKKENGESMSMEEIKDNLVLLMFAGHDTTYASMGTALHCLSAYPEIYAELEKEAKSLKEPLDYEELKNAPVLTAFLTEMWRMYPPSSRAQRLLVEDVEFDDYKAKKGMVFKYCTHGALKNEKLYEDPYHFDIQRFLPDDHPLLLDPKMKSNGHKFTYSYPVFGGGVRSCIGIYFAKLEMRLFLTRLFQMYKLEVRNDERVHSPIGGWKNEFRLTSNKE